jgi:hypothetical protein
MVPKTLKTVLTSSKITDYTSRKHLNFCCCALDVAYQHLLKSKFDVELLIDMLGSRFFAYKCERIKSCTEYNLPQFCEV